MKTKQVIRLTEGDLHNIIKESVENVLSEMDWKTGAWAEKRMNQKIANFKNANPITNQMSQEDKEKRNQQLRKLEQQKQRFNQYKIDRFNQQYGYQDGKHYNSPYVGMVDNGSHVEGSYTEKPSSGQSWNNMYSRRDDFGYSVHSNNPNDRVNHGNDLYSSSWHNNINNRRSSVADKQAYNNYMNAFNKASKEYSDYHNNNYEYNKNNGWQLKK